MNRALVGGLAGAAAVAAAAAVWWWWPASEAPAAPTSPSASPSATPSTTSPSPSASATPSPAPEPTLAWGPTLAEWDAALADAQALSVEQAAGQVLVAAVSTTSADAVETLVGDLGLGGVIVMGDAVTDADGVRALTEAAQRGGADRDWDTIVSVDQEGGAVSRLRPLVPGLPSFMAAGAAQDKDAVRSIYAQAAVDMSELGFTMDFAPVADVTIGLDDPIIRARSAGSDPDAVAATVDAAVAGFVDAGVTPVIKHFPGHGSVTTDSHQALPVQSATVAELAARDLVPFASAIEAGAPAIMMGHIAVAEWGVGPATLEPAAYAHLREEMGFDGVIVTDALNMGAVQSGRAAGSAAVEALVAGADVLLMSPDPAAARAAIVEAVRAGDVSRDRLDEAAARVILLSRWTAGIERTADAGDTYARDLAVAGATVAAADCAAPWVADTVSISGGFAGDRQALANGLAEHGVAVGPGGTSIAIVGADDGRASADVVVALGGPWGLSGSTADVYVGLYGRSADAMAGLADVLVGAASPGGDWPVNVDVPFETCAP
ncbi:glycoside hydrolase family 3 N-terminal domain-containing protein [uncultured Demequina sp.]|uniref:glycoside hydrolase family 3 N-terminal domain-containing protein n=1 Tax=uncultured Demequina sp. TaxID=693499 RepID=UPI0025F6B3A5|nr:glycoside hydrolase family 3 N-terminal domain-containing protein [uncultured Demequina sp.]